MAGITYRISTIVDYYGSAVVYEAGITYRISTIVDNAHIAYISSLE